MQRLSAEVIINKMQEDSIFLVTKLVQEIETLRVINAGYSVLCLKLIISSA